MEMWLGSVNETVVTLTYRYIAVDFLQIEPDVSFLVYVTQGYLPDSLFNGVLS